MGAFARASELGSLEGLPDWPRGISWLDLRFLLMVTPMSGGVIPIWFNWTGSGADLTLGPAALSIEFEN